MASARKREWERLKRELRLLVASELVLRAARVAPPDCPLGGVLDLVVKQIALDAREELRKKQG